MAEDIFGYTNAKYAGSIKGANGLLFTSKQISLVQQWSVQYAQNVQPVYECGTSNVYWAGTHSSGQLSVSRIVAKSSDNIVKLLGQLCDPSTPRIVASTETCGGSSNALSSSSSVVLNLEGCVVSSIGWGGAAQNAYISEEVAAQFAVLRYGYNGSTSVTGSTQTVAAAAAAAGAGIG